MRPSSISFRFFPVLLSLAFLVLADSAFATVDSYGNCTLCHLETSGAGVSVSGNSTTRSVSPRLDGGNTTSLPCFNAYPGDTITVTLKATPPGMAGNSFAFAITGNVVGGSMNESLAAVRGVSVSSTNLLSYSVGGSDWSFQNPQFGAYPLCA
jgi:hypothetical protein